MTGKALNPCLPGLQSPAGHLMSCLALQAPCLPHFTQNKESEKPCDLSNATQSGPNAVRPTLWACQLRELRGPRKRKREPAACSSLTGQAATEHCPLQGWLRQRWRTSRQPLLGTRSPAPLPVQQQQQQQQCPWLPARLCLTSGSDQTRDIMCWHGDKG